MGPVGRWLFILLFPSIFIVAGGVAIHAAAQNRAWARESASWPHVPGTIVQITIDKNRHLTVSYQYAAGGRGFLSSRVVFGSASSGDANRRAERYSRGQTVWVYVHPHDPSVAVLEPGPHPGNWLLPSFGTLGVVVGLGMLRFMIQATR